MEDVTELRFFLKKYLEFTGLAALNFHIKSIF